MVVQGSKYGMVWYYKCITFVKVNVTSEYVVLVSNTTLMIPSDNFHGLKKDDI